MTTSSPEARQKIKCQTNPKLESTNFTWTINDFHICRASCDMLQSSNFSVASHPGIIWSLQIPTYRFFIYLKLEVSNQVTVRVNVDIACLNERNEGIEGSVKKKMLKLPWEPSAEGYRVCLIQKFQQDYLRFLHDDKLCISCDLSILEEPVNMPISFNISECTLSDDWSSFLQNPKYSDLKLIANDGHEFNVHKIVLAARSHVFAPEFDRDMMELRESRVQVVDMNSDVLRELLRFLYTGKANVSKIAVDLFCAAEKHKLDRLKTMCAEELFQGLTAENAAEMYILADRFNSNELKESVSQFVEDWCLFLD